MDGKKRTPAQRVALLAVLTAAALSLSLLEQAIPLGLFVPVPGIRLGLSNIVILFAVYSLGTSDSFLILLCRIFLLLLLSGNVSSFFISLCGGTLSLGFMVLLKKRYKRLLSIFGVSVGGACAHNVGQVVGASLLLLSSAPLFYLPVLLVTGTLTGYLTAFAASSLLSALSRSKHSALFDASRTESERE